VPTSNEAHERCSDRLTIIIYGCSKHSSFLLKVSGTKNNFSITLAKSRCFFSFSLIGRLNKQAEQPGIIFWERSRIYFVEVYLCMPCSWFFQESPKLFYYSNLGIVLHFRRFLVNSDIC